MTQQTVKNEMDGMVETRCWNCNRLLGFLPKDSPYRIKCPKCKEMNVKEKEE